MPMKQLLTLTLVFTLWLGAGFRQRGKRLLLGLLLIFGYGGAASAEGLAVSCARNSGYYQFSIRPPLRLAKTAPWVTCWGLGSTLTTPLPGTAPQIAPTSSRCSLAYRVTRLTLRAILSWSMGKLTCCITPR